MVCVATHLVGPLLGQFIGLLSLDPQGRYGNHEIALVQRCGPLHGRVDDLGINAGDLLEDGGDV